MSKETTREREACAEFCDWMAAKMRQLSSGDEKKEIAASMCEWLAREIREGNHHVARR